MSESSLAALQASHLQQQEVTRMVKDTAKFAVPLLEVSRWDVLVGTVREMFGVCRPRWVRLAGFSYQSECVSSL